MQLQLLDVLRMHLACHSLEVLGPTNSRRHVRPMKFLSDKPTVSLGVARTLLQSSAISSVVIVNDMQYMQLLDVLRMHLACHSLEVLGPTNSRRHIRPMKLLSDKSTVSLGVARTLLQSSAISDIVVVHNMQYMLAVTALLLCDERLTALQRYWRRQCLTVVCMRTILISVYCCRTLWLNGMWNLRSDAGLRRQILLSRCV